MNKLTNLRELMQKAGVKAFITPSTDPHSGEYVPEYWQCRGWISGFDGSAGTAVVTTDKAALWTDSRYFLQAAEQIKKTGFMLMKDKLEETPSIPVWLGSVLHEGDTVAVDGWVNTVTSVEELKSDIAKSALHLITDFEPYATIWTDRPALPVDPIFIQPLEYAGESTASKLRRIRSAMNQTEPTALLLSMLDEVAWVVNMRGHDIPYTPLFVSYMLITPDDAILYVDKKRVTPEVQRYLDGEGVTVKAYDEVAEDLKSIDIVVQIQPEKTNYACYSCLRKPVMGVSPVSTMKIIKNETEIAGFRNVMVKDGIGTVKWMKWLIPAVEKGGETELSVVNKLHDFRADQPLFQGDSFANIMGYGYHGAIVHYEPTPETDIPIKPEGLLLCDVGSQYLDGTTDFTRTVPLGPLTDQMRRDYTLVLKGWIALAKVRFPRGTYGSQLDVLARTAMWDYGINYLHGTGHGVGSFMSCHEGPHQFRMNYMPQPLVPGMNITDEPAIYVEGSHGVRHENTMLVVEDWEGITFGPYYKFEPLTLVPIFTSPIVVDMLNKDELKWFNDYQQLVYEKLAPHLDDEHREWLREITKPI